MAQLRQQFLRQLTVTAAANATTLVDVVGPESPAEPPYAEGADHVTRPRQVRQNEAGWVVIDGWSGSALDSAALTVDVEVWRRGAATAQRGLDGALFPSGADQAADPQLSRVVASGVAGNDPALLAVFGGGFGGTPSKDVPTLALRAGEFVRLRLVNSGGALGPATLSAKFDLGINPADTNRLA